MAVIASFWWTKQRTNFNGSQIGTDEGGREGHKEIGMNGNCA